MEGETLSSRFGIFLYPKFHIRVGRDLRARRKTGK